MKEYNILVVDDVTSNIQTIVQYLKATGKPYKFLSANNGQTALRVIQKRTPDLIITDWEMPIMSGLDLVKQLKTQTTPQRIPVIMITGARTKVEDLKIALDAGAVDFIRKPVNQVELWARVDATLQLFEAYRTIEDQKNRELSTKTLQVHQKNEILDKLKERLQQFMLKLEVAYRPEAKEMIRLIQSNKSTDNEWDTFKLHFEQVNPRFFEKLQASYPKLSQLDLKLCAYLRIGFAQKEIANLLAVDYQSVRAHKLRVKKKMGITEDVRAVVLRV